jgi:hypothetical protein
LTPDRRRRRYYQSHEQKEVPLLKVHSDLRCTPI